ncbi:MAG: hypothetical protein ACOX5Q_01730 [Bacillota bacterium]|jgi:hypothetical protein|nr:hypothetical protein [Candidatus Fermentithermobacillaceae bacterium]
MGTIIAEHGTVKYVVKGATYYVKENFAPSVQVFKAELHPRRWKGIPETFFSNGPVEKLVSILGLGRCNMVTVKLASDMELTPEEKEELTRLVGPTFYFSRSAQDYTLDRLPFDDPELATGYQTAFDILVRNWDDGEANMALVEGVPVWFDFGVSLDPRCQNVYRFIMKLEEARRLGRVSTIVSYFMDYTRRRSQILKRAVQSLQRIQQTEIRTAVRLSNVQIPAYFAEYVSHGLSNLLEDIDIIRGAFLRENVERRQTYIKNITV